MKIEMARLWLIKSSLVATASTFIFFLVAPAFHYPLEFKESMRLIEITLPVFLAYLGTATQFLFRHPDRKPVVTTRVRSKEMLSILVKGPIVLFACMTIALLFTFGYSNRPTGKELEGGMSLDVLATALSAALGLLTVSTSTIVANLFGSGEPVDEGDG
jgi:hypothetical protein